MSHEIQLNIDIEKVAKGGVFNFSTNFTAIMYVFIFMGLLAWGIGLVFYPHDLLWGAFYSNLIYWFGISVGAFMASVIFQIVHAKWAPPIRRLAEAHVAFLPLCLVLVLITFWGRKYLFYWGHSPMPGREWWMEAHFVYIRFAVLLGLLIILMYRFARLSWRRDVGYANDIAGESSKWSSEMFSGLLKGWRGKEDLVLTEEKLSYRAPVVVIAYAIIISLFAFEMIMGMDPVFYANMFGGFIFIGNIYGGWALITLWLIYLRLKDSDYAKMANVQQLHDLGKLTFGFAILWAYLFISHFLPIWYGNLPEETQWIIVRIRENPWRIVSWIVFGCCFLAPFVVLLSRDVKRVMFTQSVICTVILLGLWLERYVIVMPQISPNYVPIGWLEILFFLGFFGCYGLAVKSVLEKYPYIAIGDPAVAER